MKVVLVDNMIFPDRDSLAELDLHPHLGLLALASVAATAGHTVDIFDPKRAIKWGQLSYDDTFHERVAAQVLSYRPDAVGFTTLGCSFIFVVGVARRLKRALPDLPILLGGPHATMLHREILEGFPQFDVIVRHEADETFPRVLDRLEQRAFETIPGVSWRASDDTSRVRSTDGKPKINDLDTLPIASYDYYPVEALELDLLRIEAGRGCPFNCTFCSTAGFFQRAFRLKSAERLVRELDLLHARYGCADFKLDHDMFTVNRRKVVEFCEAVHGRGYRWRASARVDCVDADLLGTMAQAGCVSLYFGIETGSQRMQRICQKDLDLDLVQPILQAAADVGIATTASFITGYPEETQQDQDDTLALLGRCFDRHCLTQLHILTPEPGTPMFDANRRQLAYDGYGGPYNTRLLDANDQQLVLDHPGIFSSYYYYPAVLPRDRYIFAVETIDLLRRAGPIIVGYTLRAYDGRLDSFVTGFRDFLDQSAAGAKPDAHRLQAYIAAQFGADHHLTSLFRYALLANSRADDEQDDTPAEPPRLDAQTPYHLGADVHLLADLHDCGSILERIVAEPERPQLFNEFNLGERGSYVLRVTASGAISYRIDPGVEAILRLFAEPRTCAEVTNLVDEATGGAGLAPDFLKDLVRLQILVA